MWVIWITAKKKYNYPPGSQYLGFKKKMFLH